MDRELNEPPSFSLISAGNPQKICDITEKSHRTFGVALQQLWLKHPTEFISKCSPCKHLHRLIQGLNNFEMAVPDIDVIENIFCIIIAKWKDL